MKTILHVIDTTGPGGAETVFIQLADRLREYGYRSIVVIRGPGWVHDELKRRGLEPLIIPAKGAFNWRFLRQLRTIIRQQQVLCTQSHLLGSNVYCAMAGLLTNTPVVATFHGMVDVNPNERLRWLKLWLMNRGVRRFVAVSRRLQDNIEQQGLLAADKTEVIYNGVDVDRYRRADGGGLRARLELPATALLIGSLGNVRPAKDYASLIRAARRVVDASPSAHFVIAGDTQSSLMPGLQALIAELGLGNHVHFLGHVSDSAEYLSQLDIFVLSSRSEGFSIATIEAMASSLPVVVTRCGGPEEIVVDGETGLMVEPENPQALATAILALIDEPALGTALSAAARRHVAETFSSQQMIERYIKLYER